MLFDIHETDIKNCKCASYYGSTSSLIIECAKVLNISKKGLNGKFKVKSF